MEGLVMAAQLILGLSILVGLHELGHLIAAKAFGMRVEKYSIGFPPKIWGIKLGETEYSIGSLPLGGFVKISGMIDESLDTDHLNSEPEPWEFRAKPAWQRLIVMLGGIIVNVITGIFIFICLVYFLGESYTSVEEANKHGIYVNELGMELGLQRGDKIVKVNGQEFSNFSDVRNPKYLLETDASYTVLRDGKEVVIPIPSDFLDRMSEREGSGSFIEVLEPFFVQEVIEKSNAEIAGLKNGDKIVEVNNTPIVYFQDFRSALRNNEGEVVSMTVVRENEGEKELTVQVNEDGTVGFYPGSMLERSRFHYGLGESVQKGTQDAFSVIAVQLKAFKKIFSGDMSASKSISGPIGIAKFFGGTWDWIRFWTIAGMLSMVLAFMNFLPIPALDGGHVVFLSYEIISGRPPSDKFLETSQKVGMVLLLSLMVFAFGNDIYKALIN
ncbi:RIP metalloprotease RseP [Flammeovirgaceae bacterium SG7u.111]|nr:RIP metalloprotease RseP [Flammeovirgaceae bacterium SG7u.132]WPO35349.1 RIP metalloprotease RseP [Flammeovirgaceae bacterium SG7u.111]